MAAAAASRMAAGVVRTGWDAMDAVLPGGGLARGALHEWFVAGPDEGAFRGAWRPPLGVLIHLVRRALASATTTNAAKNATPWDVRSTTPGDMRNATPKDVKIAKPKDVRSTTPKDMRSGTPGDARNAKPRDARHAVPTNATSPVAASHRCVWIGPAIWPYPVTLHAHDPALLSNSLFLRVCNARQRLSAAVTVLRSRAAAVVVADGSGFDLTATRRLQLAAESGSAICLLARPPWERGELSAARTRWLIRPSLAPPDAQRWTVELLRCKGVQPTDPEACLLWTLERRHATRDVVVAADVGD